MNSDAWGRGVYYHPADYCGVWRRLLVDVIDVVAGFGLVFLVLVGIVVVQPEFAPTRNSMFLLLFVVWFAYFVGVKASPLRTLGYRVGGVKVVTLRGHPLPLWTHGLRFLFMVLGPANFLIDMLWLSTDAHRQTIRDKLAHSYVVKAHATPAGHGRIVYPWYFMLGWAFTFQEVQSPAR